MRRETRCRAEEAWVRRFCVVDVRERMGWWASVRIDVAAGSDEPDRGVHFAAMVDERMVRLKGAM